MANIPAGVAASVAVVVLGVASLLAPRLSPSFADLNARWTGLFWALVGLGVLGISTMSGGSSGRWVSGVVLGGGLLVYGVPVAAGRGTPDA